MNLKIIVAFLSLFCISFVGCSTDNTTYSTTDTATQNQSKYFRQSNWPSADSGKAVEPAANLIADNYYIVLDGSSSMTYTSCADGERKIDVAKRAIKEFVDMLPRGVNVGLLAFDYAGGISERVSIGPLNKKVFSNTIDAVGADSSTPLDSAIKLSYEKLVDQARKQLGSGTYHLVIVTDGDASIGENPASIIKKILEESPVMIHTVGFCIGKDHVLNQPGKTVYSAANNPEELRAGLKEILAELPTFVAVQ